MGSIIKLVDVNKEYDSGGHVLPVLSNINVDIERGSFCTIIGPSGCGKSTLLNIIAGLATASSGKVLVDDQQVTKPDPKKMAMVFQELTLLPWRTVRANVEFALEVAGAPKAKRRETAAKFIDLVGLSGFRDYFPLQLSGGMQQRVAIARALSMGTEILLMDEPFGALDEQTRIILGKELTRLWQTTKKTIVFVTHSLIEATYLSDNIVVMSARPGKVREVVNVTVPRPREPEGIELAEIRRGLWNQISEEANKQAMMR